MATAKKPAVSASKTPFASAKPVDLNKATSPSSKTAVSKIKKTPTPAPGTVVRGIKVPATTTARTVGKPGPQAATKSPAPATVKPAAAPAALKPIKTAFTKTSLQTHLADVSGVDTKTVKAVLGALEATILASMNKKGLGEFTLPGLVAIRATAVAAKKKRRGLDPFTKVEREFPAKPATVRVTARVLKKLKTAAL